MTRRCPTCRGRCFVGDRDDEPCARCFGSGELQVYTGRIRERSEDLYHPVEGQEELFVD